MRCLWNLCKKKEKKIFLPSNNIETWDYEEQEAFRLMNIERLKHDRKTLIPEEELYRSAERRAIHYARLGTIQDHKGWQIQRQRLINLGLKTPAEIVGWAFEEPSYLINAWLRSPKHRRELLYNRHTFGAVAFAKGKYSWYWVAYFART